MIYCHFLFIKTFKVHVNRHIEEMAVDQKYSYARKYETTHVARKYMKSNHIRANRAMIISIIC